MIRLAIAALLVLLVSCASQRPRIAAPAAQPTPLLLVSIDSFRPDYLDRGLTPTLTRLAREGVRSTGMQPAFPTVTFPNHYTIVTGLYPDHHGIVENTMDDPAIPGVRFSMSNRDAVEDERWWDEATPIWNSADQAGLRTATMFWPGSEAPIHGRRPDFWKSFDKNATALQRVDQVLAWLDLPPSQRPRFITLYFDSVDRNGHDQGPDAPEVDAAMTDVDSALAHLLAGLQQRGLRDRINIVVVSDHGMAAVPTDHHIVLDDLVPSADFDAVTLGAVAELRVLPGDDAIVGKNIVGRQDHMQCWRKQDIPARLHYGSNPRIPPFVCLADIGWLITTHARMAEKKLLHAGEHGYDNNEPLMRALFIAHGPAFRSGVVLPGFPNVDVYPLLAKLLGIRPEPNDGDLAPLLPALR